LPIETFDLIGQDDTGSFKAGGKRDFEWIAFYLRSDGAEEGEARFPVIGFGREGQSKSVTRLLMPSLRRKRQPDHIAPLRAIGLGH